MFLWLWVATTLYGSLANFSTLTVYDEMSILTKIKEVLCIIVISSLFTLLTSVKFQIDKFFGDAKWSIPGERD